MDATFAGLVIVFFLACLMIIVGGNDWTGSRR